MQSTSQDERAIGRLDILSAYERPTVLREWNATARTVPGVTLPELFAARLRARLTRTRWCSRTSGGRGNTSQWRSRDRYRPVLYRMWRRRQWMNRLM